MKINLPSVKAPLSPSTDATRASSTGESRTVVASGSASGSPVALSSTARHLASLENTDHDINTVRVNELRDALAAGTLKINPERIADGLIASARELLAHK